MKKYRRRFTPGHYKLKVGRSKTGLGLFAQETIPRRTCIVEYTGRNVVGEEQYDSRSKYLFETGRGTMIDGNTKTNTAKYINHSCAPNCEIELYKHRIYVFSLRNIKPGEELTYDYDTEYFDEHIKPKGCKCDKCTKKHTK